MTETGKQFRIQNKNIHLVYKTHIPLELIREKLKLREDDVFKMKVAHEKGDPKVDESDQVQRYEHTHVFVSYEKRVDSINSRIFDIVNDGQCRHPYIEIVKTPVHVRRTIKYLSKENPIYSDFPDVEEENVKAVIDDAKVMTYEELAGTHAKKISDLVGLSVASKMLHKGEETRSVITKLKPWQKEVLAEVMLNAKDNRKVLWVYDPIGGSGKNELIKFLSVHYAKHDKWLSNHTSFNQKDVFYAISKGIDKRGKSPSAVALNITRSSEFNEIYAIIENLKDAQFSSDKYESKTVNMTDAPAVVVFSNKLPQYNKLTLNRWLFYVVSGDGDTGLKGKALNLAELTKFAGVTSNTRSEIEPKLNEIIHKQHTEKMADIKTKTHYAKLIKKIFDLHNKSPEQAEKVSAAIKKVFKSNA